MFSDKNYGGTNETCEDPVVVNIAWKRLTVTRKELRNFSFDQLLFS